MEAQSFMYLTLFIQNNKITSEGEFMFERYVL